MINKVWMIPKFTGVWIKDPGYEWRKKLEQLGFDVTHGVNNWQYEGDDRRGQIWVFRGEFTIKESR